MPALIAPTPQETLTPVLGQASVQAATLPSGTPQTVTLPGTTSMLSPTVVTPRDVTEPPAPTTTPIVVLPPTPAAPLPQQSFQGSIVVSSDSGASSQSDSTPTSSPASPKQTCVAVPTVPLPLVSGAATATARPPTASTGGSMRLNKFVRRLHDMLQSEQNSGIVEWRRGLLVLHSTDAFAKTILPKYFNTRNFKTFRRQLNYYGFVHVRSFSTTGSTTTALWVNRDLAKNGTDNISSVLQLKRVEPCESAKTAEGRRVRKELAVSTVEDDIGISAKSIQLEQIRSMSLRREREHQSDLGNLIAPPHIPQFVHCPTTTNLPPAPPLLPRVVTATTEPDNESAANLLLMLSKSAVVS